LSGTQGEMGGHHHRQGHEFNCVFHTSIAQESRPFPPNTPRRWTANRAFAPAGLLTMVLRKPNSRAKSPAIRRAPFLWANTLCTLYDTADITFLDGKYRKIGLLPTTWNFSSDEPIDLTALADRWCGRRGSWIHKLGRSSCPPCRPASIETGRCVFQRIQRASFSSRSCNQQSLISGASSVSLKTLNWPRAGGCFSKQSNPEASIS
jgi:hypothetical protein